MKIISITNKNYNVAAKFSKSKMSKVNKAIPKALERSLNSFTFNNEHNLKDNLLFILKKHEDGLRMTVRKQGVLSWLATNLFNKKTQAEIIEKKEFEHGFTTLFTSATERLYRRHSL